MNRIIVATIAAAAIAGAASCSAAAAPANDGQRGLLSQVNSTGWGSRINKDRYPNGYGFTYNEDESRYAPGFYDDEAGSFGHGHRGRVRAAPYGYGYDPEDGAF